ncbi:MAG: hypothetical protein HOV80_11315 [Polyangiaceae bacterium]|nr:hypothetical protein [Polyangiaceae bacterium]
MSRWLVVLLAFFASGCTVDVILGVDEVCDGRTSGSPWSDIDKDGCTLNCHCGEDGAVSCVKADAECPRPPVAIPVTCTWPEEGLVLAPQDTKISADSCTTCTCTPEGTLSCTMDPCCEAPPFDCEQTDPLSGCYSVPVCGPMGWECAAESCDCGNQEVPYCPEPPPDSGCAWTGLECGPDGFYSCGTLVCPSCDPGWNDCGDPMIPGCVYEKRCDQGVFPVCELVCNTCQDPPIQCTPSSMECTSTPICGPMGTWDGCDEECPVACDPALLGVCDSVTPGCRGAAVCLETNWYCTDVCGM